MKTLIIEFQTSGHYPEYLKHVLAKIDEDQSSSDFLIFLNPFLKQHLKGFEEKEVYKSMYFFDKSLGTNYSQLENTKQMADFIYAQILNIKKEHDFQHVLFLNLNLILRHYSILNPFKNTGFTFSGIVLNSPYRFREQYDNKFVIFKREFYLRLLAINKNCTKIFILNDKKGANFYSKWSSKFKYIVDPVRISPASNLDIYKHHNIDPSKLVFTQIGKLSKYKGTSDIFNSIRDISPKLLDKMHFLFIGKTNADIDNDIDNWINSKFHNYSSIRNEFISDQDFTAYIKQSHVILITNKNAENSSGIVNHCLANNKVVIAPNKGYYKDIFKDYEAVILYDDHFSLSQAITYAFHNFNQLLNEAKKFNSEKFISENTSEKFAATLLNSIYQH